MELVKQNSGIRSMIGFECGRAECLPHIHYSQPNLLTLISPKPLIEFIHTLFRTLFPPKPDGAPTDQVAYNNSVRVPFLDCPFINPYDLWPWYPNPSEL